MLHLLLAALALGPAALAQTRPNLIVIYTDDQRVDALGASGNSRIHTPSLDRLAARGVRFTNANVVFSLCSPSRAALLTGRYGSANGVTGLGGALRDGEKTFAQILKARGYRTAMVGKWHLKTRVPDAGFDFRCYFQSNGTYFGRRVWDNTKFVKPKQHVDDYCVQRSIDFLEDAAERDTPFLLFHNTQLPHMDHRQSWPTRPETRKRYTDDAMPLAATWRGDLRGKPPYLETVRNREQAENYGYRDAKNIRKHVGDYYSVITEMDAMLGKLFDAVDRLGLAKNTYIVFLSDNGWLLGEHRMSSKVLAYAPSVRVPMIIVGPGIRPGTESRIALNIDVAPTLLELAGAEPPAAMHGRSLVPLLRRESTKWRDAFVYEGIGTYGGARPTLAACSDRFRLILTYASLDAIRSGSKPSFVELYDTRSDPDETANVANEKAEIRRELATAIEAHVRTHLATRQVKSLQRVARGAGARSFSGIYPHLASFNKQNECGTGAVVPWAGKLWWLTYAPHKPRGSDDKLYAMNAARDLFVSPRSVGGTPANRMIHEESKQLFIGPYAISDAGNVRVIPYSAMLGRTTGNARHLTDPENKIYYATMEEGIYEVDVKSLAVKTLFADTHAKQRDQESGLPGYHGKGLYSGQGRLVYSNNGEKGRVAQTRPDIRSGVLAEWPGDKAWQVVRRNQFTEVTGPGGIRGNRDPGKDPIWSVGWDHRSLLLMLRSTKRDPKGAWHRFRLPKASHSYDGAHGWNTEWPRIREIGEDQLLMTMHGTFWSFPKRFDLGATSGIAPLSNYLKIVGDFCRFGDHVVFGCDDAARSEFLNKRKAKGEVAGPAESQSNLWFVEPSRIHDFGLPIGHGGVFVDDAVEPGRPSDPMLFTGYTDRAVHLAHDAKQSVTFTFEVDAGDGTWRKLRDIEVGAGGYRFHAFTNRDRGAWIRVSTNRACKATVWFEYREEDGRGPRPQKDFASLARASTESVGGLLRAGDRKRGLQILATTIDGESSKETGYYELSPDLRLRRVDSAKETQWMRKRVALPTGVLTLDGHSILYVDDDGGRWRLPIGNPAYRGNPRLLDLQRTAREVTTERDLFQCAGTFFELPARNAGGFAKVRPVSTHTRFVQDYCSWRGLLVMTGVRPGSGEDERMIWSKDRKCAVWLGTIDDLWTLGHPRGQGGPWTESKVRKDVPSDPFLMTGYDSKSLTLSHDAARVVRVGVEVDITGAGSWQRYVTLEAAPGEETKFDFPPQFAAYWVRVVADHDCQATARFDYR